MIQLLNKMQLRKLSETFTLDYMHIYSFILEIRKIESYIYTKCKKHMKLLYN